MVLPSGVFASPPRDEPVKDPGARKPLWSGVNKVEVVGGFGLTSDWSKTSAFATLKNDGTGNWTDTAQLPDGQYLYVFRVTGDVDTSEGAAYVRYAVDPLDTAYAACPSQSPTYSATDPNPCSRLTVPQGAAAPAVQVSGTLLSGGNPAAGWLVEIERDEAKSHHFFANRVTLDKTGSFALVGSTGSYRLQALNPQFYKATDLALDPTAIGTLRRAISDAIPLATSAVMVTTPDVTFGSYGIYAPVDASETLPTQFTFQSGGPTRLTVYGGPGDGGVEEIGDPWFASAPVVDGGAAFDGAFNTAQATADAAALGTRYMWGTEDTYDASVGWTRQTLVFPIAWH
jgi:hypothetical protein